MIGSSLKIIKGVSSLVVLSHLRPNIDDSSWFVPTKEIYFFNPYMDSFVEQYFQSSLFVVCSNNLFNYDSNIFERCILSRKFISAGLCAKIEDDF